MQVGAQWNRKFGLRVGALAMPFVGARQNGLGCRMQKKPPFLPFAAVFLGNFRSALFSEAPVSQHP